MTRPARGNSRLWIGASTIAVIVVASVFAPVLAPFGPLKQDYNYMLVGPMHRHLLGTDEFGRDILSRLLYGGRISLAVAAGSVLIASAIGVPLGVAGGYFGGLADILAMRLSDLIVVFPPILLAIAVVAFFGSSILNLTVVIGFVYFPRFARLAYATTLTAKTHLFVEASHAIGAGTVRMLQRHILPTILAPLVVQGALALGFAVLLESGLSFLGLGVQPPAPSWGLMVADARAVMAQNPSYIVFPSAAITVAILAFQLAADGLQDALDPRRRGRGGAGASGSGR